MRKLIVTEYVTLDGVFEAPGGGEAFEHGGWSFASWNDESAQYKFDELQAMGAMLLGRVTYAAFAQFWPTYTDEAGFADRMNSLPKYVVSTTLTKGDWNNTTVIQGNLAEEIGRLKQQPGQDIFIAGSGQLVRSLMPLNLIDEYRLMVHPVVLGAGRRLFDSDASKQVLKLVASQSFGGGIAVLHYEPVPAAA